jgi:glutamate formiminotransferase
MKKLIECVPNFSEGKYKSKINKIFNTAKSIKNVKVFELEWDKSHNRSLFTIVGAPKEVLNSVYEAIKVATELIDMRKHTGEHPRVGATDVVPFVPISGVSMKECVTLAKKLGKRVAGELKIPVYLYEEAATRPDRVNLAKVRKGQYEGLKEEILINIDRKPDYGPSKLHKTAGAIIIGARKYLIAYNVNLDTKDVEIAKKIAIKIREKDGGMQAVKAMGFEVDGSAQVSMNLIDYEVTNIDVVYREIEKWAKRYKVKVKNSEIYGMIPQDALVKMVRTTLKADGFKSEQILENRLFE